VKMHRVRLVLRNGRKVDIHFPATGSDLWIVGAEFADGTYGDRLFDTRKEAVTLAQYLLSLARKIYIWEM